MNRRKNQNTGRNKNFQKNKKAENFSESKKQNKGIQCRECEGFEHIQFECTNTLKKKGKSLKSTRNDEEFEGSKEEDDHISNYIAFQVTSKKNVSTSVSTDVATVKATKTNFNIAMKSNTESDLDSGDGEELITKDIQKVYQIM